MEDSAYPGMPGSDEWEDLENREPMREKPRQPVATAPAVAEWERPPAHTTYLIRYHCQNCLMKFYLQNSFAVPSKEFAPTCPYCREMRSAYNGIAEWQETVGLRPHG